MVTECATELRYRVVVPDTRELLRAATRRYRDTAADHNAAREAAIAAVLAALRAGDGPSEVERLSPFTAAYVRRAAEVAETAEFTDMGRVGHYLLRGRRSWNAFALESALRVLGDD